MSFVADIQANIDNWNTNLDRAQSRLDAFAQDVGQKVAKLGSTFQLIGGALSVGVTAPMVAAGVAAFNMAADFEDALGATEQIFKEASEATKDWANKLPTYFGVAKQEALEYSNMMGSMLVNIGNLTEQEASKQSTKLIELAGDLTAMYGGTTQDAVRALTGALKGNTTMLDNYGMAANDALVKAKAYSMGLVEQGKELDLASKQAATLALIYEQSGAAQGQAAREADGASGSMRAFRTEVANLSTELGTVLLPIITPIISGIKDVIAGFRGLSPETQKMIVYVGAAAAAIGPLLLGLGTLMQLAPLVGSAFAVMTGPIGITVAAIGASVALIIKYWDEIKAYFTNGAGSKVWDNISKTAQKVWSNLIKIFNAVKEFVIAVWDKIGSNVMAIVGNTFDTVFAIIGSVIGQIIGVINVFTSLIRGDFSGAFEAAKNVVKGIFNAIKTIVINVLANVTQALSAFLKFIGADNLGSSLENWAKGLKPVQEESVKTAEKVEEVSNKLGTQTKKVKENTESLEENKKKQVDYRKELDNTLASWGIYESQIKVLNRTFKELDNTAKAAKATQEELQAILSRNWLEKALLDFQKLGNDPFKNSNLTKLNGGITIPIKLDIQLAGGKYETIISDLGATAKSELEDLAKQYDEIISQGVFDIADSIGTAFIENNNLLAAVGESVLATAGGLLKNLGKIAIQEGLMVIGMGKALAAAVAALKTLNPAVAIAAGLALTALGAAFSAGSAKLGKSMESGGGGSSSAYASSAQSIQPSMPRGSYYNNDKEEYKFRISGGDIVGAVKINNNRNNRLG